MKARHAESGTGPRRSIAPRAATNTQIARLTSVHASRGVAPGLEETRNKPAATPTITMALIA